MYLVPELLLAATTQPVLPSIDATIDAWIRGYGTEAEGIFRLILAAILGGLVGMEREIRGHEAGLRTFMLVTAGAALAMIVSRAVANWDGEIPVADNVRVTIDPARIAYGVMTGVGFLGAGTIIQRRSRVHGLTTAAGIWSVAALGLAVGQGLYVLSVLATLLMLVTLFVLSLIQPFIPARHQRRVQIEVPYHVDCMRDVRHLLSELGLRERRLTLQRSRLAERVILDVTVRYFRQERFRKLTDRLITHPDWRLLKITH